MQAQRAHQNNVEFTSVYMAVFLATGLVAGDLTMKVALAGASVLGFRVVNGLGYAYGGAKHPLKRLGGLFHIGEVYTLYLAGSIAYRMVQ